MGHETPSDDEPVAGRYTLDRMLGAGGAAVVYEGRDLATKRTVALKVYRQDGSAHPRIQQNREIAALAKLRHANLVTLYDGGTEEGPDGRTYLVMDFVEGPTLAERLLEGPLHAPVVRDLAAALASALAHVHAHGFIHRDVKPANILLEHGGEPRLADFGIAKALDGTVVTASGAISGTAAYLAPEQARGELVGSAADVYALGLVLLEALTGRREYPGTAIESATARLHRRPAVPAGLPFNLSPLLTSMTDPDPAARPTAEAVAASLDPAAEPAPAPARRRAPALVAAALLISFVVGGASLLVGASGTASGAGNALGSTSPVAAATPTAAPDPAASDPAAADPAASGPAAADPAAFDPAAPDPAAAEPVATEPSREPLTPPPADDVVVGPSSAREESATPVALYARTDGPATDAGKAEGKSKGNEKSGEKAKGAQKRGRGHDNGHKDEHDK